MNQSERDPSQQPEQPHSGSDSDPEPPPEDPGVGPAHIPGVPRGEDGGA